jgi:hypothetical protein
MKSKDKPGREPKKAPAPETVCPIRDNRDALRRAAVLRESDAAFRSYWESLSPRDQERLPRP